jgi:hypothetical protein
MADNETVVLKNFKEHVNLYVEIVELEIGRDNKAEALKYFDELVAETSAWKERRDHPRVAYIDVGIAHPQRPVVDVKEIVDMASKRYDVAEEAVQRVRKILQSKGWL